MTQGGQEDEEEGRGRPPGRPPGRKREQRREPLRQLSVRPEPAPPRGPSEGTRAIPTESTGEPARPRDWIHPIPQDKPQTTENWAERKSEMMADLSYCVDVSTSMVIQSEGEEADLGEEVDLSDVLGGLD